MHSFRIKYGSTPRGTIYKRPGCGPFLLTIMSANTAPEIKPMNETIDIYTLSYFIKEAKKLIGSA